MTKVVIEITQFQLVKGVADQEFLREAEEVQQVFLKRQPGYLDRELLKGEAERWADILHWETTAQAQAAAQAMLQEPACQGFLSMIDPQSIEMLHLERQKKWDEK
jgi:heme-degrading monooxygenase HmoA